MAAHVTHLQGDMEPATMERLESLVNELDHADGEHTDVSVCDESGWTLSAFASGLPVWENVEEDEAPRHTTGLTRTEVLRHFGTLVNGEVDLNQPLPWSPGYG